MKILMPEWAAFGFVEIIRAFEESGHEIKKIPFPTDEPRHNPQFEKELGEAMDSFNPDFVFTFNFFPVVSLVCNDKKVKYASWIYDSPYVLLYSYTVAFPCNYIFVFDKELYQEFNANKINTVYYLPLAADAKHLALLNDYDSFNASGYKMQTDIAFVGNLYNDNHQFYNRLSSIKPYTRGYLEGIMASQKNVYGYNFIKKVLPQSIRDDMYTDLPMEPNPEGVESQEYLYAQYVINRQITAMERTLVLETIGQKYGFDLYTKDSELKMQGCINHGKCDPITTAPYVYKSAKINLNISLRSITSGVPLRCFDILGSEGFLISNYQADFDDVYVADEEYVYYDSIDDLMNKIDYYLTNDKRRRTIAHNGYLRTLNEHTYVHRVKQIIDTMYA